MAGDAFDAEDPDEQERNTTGGAGLGTGGAVSYGSTGGSTTGRGSPGFVNLGQMLALNRKSGQESADSLNKSVDAQATNAQAGVRNAEDSFMTQSDAASPGLRQGFQDGGTRAETNKILGAGPYAGPKRLDDIGKLQPGQTEDTRNQGMNMTKVRGDVSNATDRLNQIGSADGRAAEAAKTGLSARQGAASSFYMGSSNPMFKQTQDKFKGLSSMLTDAQGRAQAYGAGGQERIDAAKRGAGGRAAMLDNIDDAPRRQAEMDDAADKAAWRKYNESQNTNRAGLSPEETDKMLNTPMGGIDPETGKPMTFAKWQATKQRRGGQYGFGGVALNGY